MVFPHFSVPPCSLNLVLSDYLTNKFVSLIRLGFHPLSYYAPPVMLQARETRNLRPEIGPNTPSDVTSGNEISLKKTR